MGVVDINKIFDVRMLLSLYYDKYFVFYGCLNGLRGCGGWCVRIKNDRDYF